MTYAKGKHAFGSKLEVDPESGKAVWLPRGSAKFDNLHAGKEAGFTRSDGYVQIRLDGKIKYRHRIVYESVHGEIPSGFEVDHINGVPGDDRICNLRLVNKGEQQKNLKLFKTNTSGHVGVCKGTRRAWQAGIWHKNKRYHLGEYDSLDDAVAARKAAEIRYGYHSNHGVQR